MVHPETGEAVNSGHPDALREVFIIGSEPKLSTASPLAPDDSSDTTASPQQTVDDYSRFYFGLKMARSDNRLRRTIRYEAARIMAEEGIRDYRRAKRKPVCVLEYRLFTRYRQILKSRIPLAEQLSIFAKESVQELHRQYLETACAIMQLLRDYSPRVTGAALSGKHHLLTPR